VLVVKARFIGGAFFVYGLLKIGIHFEYGVQAGSCFGKRQKIRRL